MRLEERLMQKLEKRLVPKITRQVMGMVHEEFYPPEAIIKKKLMRDVEAASKRLKGGKGKIYSYKEFKDKFLAKK